MDQGKRERLEEAGWQVGTVQEFLGMSDEEAAFVELTVHLTAMLRERRTGQRLTQAELARRIGSSQSRVAKIEAGDPSVSLDLLVRAIFATGATARDIADAIAPDERTRVA
jgi:DNA-binding XRE family transcriptional regulator